MAPPVYHYLCGTDMASISVAEYVLNFKVRHLLKQEWILNKSKSESWCAANEVIIIVKQKSW